MNRRYVLLAVAVLLGACREVAIQPVEERCEDVEPAKPIRLPAQATEPSACDSGDVDRPWRAACGRRYDAPVGEDGPIECMDAHDCDCLAAYEGCAPELRDVIEADTPAWCLDCRAGLYPGFEGCAEGRAAVQ